MNKGSYRLEFDIAGTPKATNALLGYGFWTKHKNADLWKNLVAWRIHGKTPERPLMRAKITLVRFNNRMLDFDGLVASFKPVVDGLVGCGVLWNDTWAVTGKWDVDQIYSPKGHDRIQVTIEEVEIPEKERLAIEKKRAAAAAQHRKRRRGSAR